MRPPGEEASGPGVRVLYSEGCPGSDSSARVLREVLSQTAPDTAVELVLTASQAFLDLGSPGSPTILVNGLDLFPPDEAYLPGAPAAGSTLRP